MNAENELNSARNKINMLIREMYPELSLYLGEMPVTNSGESSSVFNSQALTDYSNSLKEFIKTYTHTHLKNNKITFKSQKK